MAGNGVLVAFPTNLLNVGVGEAEQVIAAVFAGKVKTTTERPDPAKLAQKVATLQAEWSEIHLLNGSVTYGDLDQIYRSSANKAEILKASLETLVSTWSATYFLNDSQPDHVTVETLRSESDAIDLLSSIIARLRYALQALATSGHERSKEKWLQHQESSAASWLWRVGFPKVFKECFKSDYTLPSDAYAETEGLRFAIAVSEVAGFPINGVFSMASHLHGKRSGGENSKTRRPSVAVGILYPDGGIAESS